MKDNKLVITILSILLIIESLAGSYFIYQANSYRNERNDARKELALLKTQLEEVEQAKNEELNTVRQKVSELESETEENLVDIETSEGVESDEGDIIVTSPREDDLASGSVIVAGQARVFENNVSIRIKDANDSTITETFTTAEGEDIGEFGVFSLTVNFGVPETATGVVEVFEVSAQDGSEVNKVIIPITFFEE